LNNSRIKFEDLLLFENDDFILVNKPPFLSTLEDRNEKINLLRLARTYTPDAQVCHRLDKDTSGVLAIAKNPVAYRHLSMQFEKREVTKVYHAVVDGIHRFDETVVDLPILKQPDGMAKISKREGKPAVTFFTSIQPFRHHTLVACKPVTGRMHQIRLHISHLGAPITGDELYGGKPFFLSQVKRKFNLKKDTEEEPLIKRMALHAFSLEFRDLSESTKIVEAPYPKDMQVLVKQLQITG
jgi:23S rRNA pseudouridine955/2504/2580 synthase